MCKYIPYVEQTNSKVQDAPTGIFKLYIIVCQSSFNNGLFKKEKRDCLFKSISIIFLLIIVYIKNLPNFLIKTNKQKTPS